MPNLAAQIFFGVAFTYARTYARTFAHPHRYNRNAIRGRQRRVRLHRASLEPLTKDEKTRASQCLKKIGEVKTNSQGQYRFENLEPGWYALWFNWKMSVPFRVDAYTFGYSAWGSYRTFYKAADTPRTIIVGAVGYPFYVSSTGSTVNLRYNTEPYEDEVSPTDK
jgi:hypothetical protein